MQLVKKIFIGAVMIAASSTAFAESGGDAKVRAALEGTIEKIEHAIKFVEEKGSEEAVNASITQARQLQKEYRFEGTERERQRANEVLRKARELLKEDKRAEADVALKDALKSFKEMEVVYNKTHKK
jgi:acyl-CoA reductase-like NAD-dependent aldehyde dehydrogenase